MGPAILSQETQQLGEGSHSGGQARKPILAQVVLTEPREMVEASRHQEVVMASVDFKAAFPTLTPEALLASLREVGISPSAMSVVVRLHQDETGEMVQILQGTEDSSRQAPKGEWLCSQPVEPPQLPTEQTGPRQQPGDGGGEE